MKLSRRLRALAAFVPPGARVVDVGTDHAYLPVWLVEKGLSPCAIGTEIRPGPAAHAEQTIREAGLADKISVRLTDGLCGLHPDSADAVVLAGMGGETIAGVLSRAGWNWQGKVLILQPMSKQELLCSYLAQSGFAVCDEALVEDGGELYRVLQVRPGAWSMENPAWLYAGAPLLQKRDPLLPAYLDEWIARLSRAISGMERGGEYTQAQTLRERLAALQSMRGETEKW